MQEHLGFFVLGDTSEHVHESRPLPPRKNRFYIPVEFMGKDDLEALSNMQNQLEAFGLQKPTSEIALFIQDSPAFKSHLQSDLYPVAIPADETAIYKTYSFVDDVKERNKNRRITRFRKLNTVGLCINFILYKANYSQMERDGIRVPRPGSQSQQSLLSDRSNPAVDQIAEHLSRSTFSPSPSPRAPRTPGPSQPSAPSPRTPQTPGLSQPSTPSNMERRHPTTSWTPIVQNTHHAMPEQHVMFRQIRTLTGEIIEHEFEATSMPTSTSLLGRAADEYIWVQGFAQGSASLIRHAYRWSNSEGDFVHHLSKEGMAVVEAWYLYNLITQHL